MPMDVCAYLGHREFDLHSELANFAAMIVKVAEEILNRPEVTQPAADNLVRELSSVLDSVCEQHALLRTGNQTDSENARNEMTAMLALLKLQVVIAPERTNVSPRLMSLYQLLSERLAAERWRYEQMAKEATRTLSAARRALLLLEWTDRLRVITDDTTRDYVRRYNNSAAAMPEDAADIISDFVVQTEAAWRAYLWRLRFQTWIDGCHRIFVLRSPA